MRNFTFINWKNKLDVIEGILCYYNLYDNDIIYNSIFPQCITFCLDDIYKVRKTSSKVLATLIEYLYNINYKKEQLFKIIESFAMHKKFQQRIIFVKMCKIFLNNKNLYEEKIKNILLDLIQHEKIKDVKINLSRVLQKIIKNDKKLLYKDETIHKICYLLNKEKIRSINDIFHDVNIRYKELNEGNDIITENNEVNNDDKMKEKYFKGDNEFFIKEFKIELEKKNSSLNSYKNSANNKSNNMAINTNININVNDVNDINNKIKEEKKENTVDKTDDKKE